MQTLQDFHKAHLEFHQRFPERFSPMEDADFVRQIDNQPGIPTSYETMPVYFGNVCLRFIPVFDIVVHRYGIAPVKSVLQIHYTVFYFSF